MENIYYVRGSEQVGPFSEADIRAKVASGEITADTLVWWDGLPEWTALSTTPLGAPASGGVVAAPMPSAPAPLPMAGVAPSAEGTKTSTLALVSLITSLVGLFCGILSIVAVVTGHMARGEIKKNPHLTGSGMALAGLIIGYITIVLMAVAVIFYFAVIGVAIKEGMNQAQQDQANQSAPTTNTAPAVPTGT